MVAGSNYWDQNIAVIVPFFVGILRALMLFANTVLTKRVAFAAIRTSVMAKGAFSHLRLRLQPMGDVHAGYQDGLLPPVVSELSALRPKEARGQIMKKIFTILMLVPLALPLAAQILPSTSVDPKIDGVFGNEEYAVVQELQGAHIVIGFDASSSQTISEETDTTTTLEFLCRMS